jgi:hypothetical protein
VDWLFGRFRRSGGHAALVCYLRENGPIAYAADVFDRDARERASAMLATDLAWYWKTVGKRGVAREWTRLTTWSLAALLADMNVALDAGVEPRLVLVAIDGDDAPTGVSDTLVAGWMRAFNSGADHPLHVVVTRPGLGQRGDLLFVAQQPPESVRRLLQSWGIDRDTAQRRAYAKLQAHSLESVARSLRRPSA